MTSGALSKICLFIGYNYRFNLMVLLLAISFRR